jgi:hypothetical protein
MARKRRGLGNSDELGFIGGPGVAGPIIGGGLTQAVSLVAKMLLKDKPNWLKWTPALGFVAGAGLSGVLAVRKGTRDTGIAGLVTAALVAVPQQVENLMGPSAGSTQGYNGYLGIITPEEAPLQGYFGEPEQPAVQLLGGGSGLGITTVEQEVAGFGESPSVPPVELLGSGFGSNFLS